MSPASARDAVREILVRAPNWLGDLVMATPALRALRVGFPSARISVQVRPGLEPLLAGSPRVDRVMPVASYHRGLRALRVEARQLRAQGPFDLGVCLADSYSSAALMRLGGVRHVVGYRRGARAPLLHRPVDPAPEWGARRMVARETSLLALVRSLGIPAEDERTELFTTAHEESALRSLLASLDLAGAREPLVGLAPGASYGSAKRWPLESFAKLADALVLAGFRPLLIGAPDEVEICARVGAAMRAPVADLSGRLDPGTLKALIRRLALVIGNDAGARHVAVALGVPCIVLIGPTSLAKTDANLGRVSVLATDHTCRPCYLRECPIDHRCLRDIGPERVIEHAIALLQGEAGNARGGLVAEATA